MATLNNYTFLPWLRQGIAAEIAATDNLGIDGAPATRERAEVEVSFKVNGESVSKPVHLLGPGDVVGLSPRAVVKTEPRNWVTDFEANYLPYIEFYQENLPWCFTPAKAKGALDQSKLRPWIFLAVLTEDEFDEKPDSRPLRAFEIKPGFDPFPKKEESWAWAHVHISRDIIGDDITKSSSEVRNVEQRLANILRANPDSASSRLLCPRKLKENTAYHAFVIPAFESGRLAGLGLPFPVGLDGQQASWGAGQKLYPIYYRWFFRTGTKGDFEFLVDLLEPRKIDPRVGVRDMDMQLPGYGVPGMDPQLDVLGLEGALKSPETVSFPLKWPPENTDFENPEPRSAGEFLNKLETKVNLQFEIQQEATANKHPDLIISPPLYGKWYAKAEKLDVRDGTGWVDELNRDPRYRASAGVGTQVIQRDQEKLMQEAWSQLGDLLQTNQKIRQLQLGLMSSYIMYQKMVVPQSSDQLMGFTNGVQARILGSPTTIARQVIESRLPRAALDPAFRKITRSRGAIMRKVAPPAESIKRPVITELNEGKLTAAPPPPEATGIMSVDKLADSIEPTGIPAWLRRWLREKIVRWILLGLLALALVLMFLTAAFIVFAVVIAVATALLIVAERLRTQIETAEAFHEAAFKPESVDRIPARPDFVLTDINQPMPAVSGAAGADSVAAANFRVALKDTFNVFVSPPPSPPVRQPLNIDQAVSKLLLALDPAVAIPKRAEFMLEIPDQIKDLYLPPKKTLVPVMAHPVFPQPMYRALRDISSELLVPNLDLISNNTISLMETNQPFIEAYMVGLNHEMACELLWREFPTDQRGSYFRQFWDVADVVNRRPDRPAAEIEEALLDIKRLHTWTSSSALGSHENRPLPSGAKPNEAEPIEAKLVLVVRGDLLKKYPTALIYAQRAIWSKDKSGRDIRVLDEREPDRNIKNPIFKAEIEPDIRFFGFDLTATEAEGNANPQAVDPGWFFVIQERPGEPRFGLDNLSGDPREFTKWEHLAWEDLGNFADLDFIDLATGVTQTPTDITDIKFAWGRNAADMAYILYQLPVMVAFHGADMLE